MLVLKYTCMAILTVFMTCGGLPLTTDTLLDLQWVRYKLEHNKLYTRVEDNIRKNIWRGHKRDIDAHNVEADMGWHTYHMKLNEFTDATPREIAYRTRFQPPLGGSSLKNGVYKKSGEPLPDSVDWRTKGWVSPVIHQGGCEASWAIAAVGAIETQLEKKTGMQLKLSVQELLDCSSSKQGCNGGWADAAFSDILSSKDRILSKESCNVYKATEGFCKRNTSCEITKLASYSTIEAGDEIALQDAVARIGPVPAGIALHTGFLSYKSGVYSVESCPKTPTHNVLIVGYGSENGLDYWLVKNSFDKKWGDEGFIKMARNQDNMCGITNRAAVPVIE